jgi:hypothetical protein
MIKIKKSLPLCVVPHKAKGYLGLIVEGNTRASLQKLAKTQ